MEAFVRQIQRDEMEVVEYRLDHYFGRSSVNKRKTQVEGQQ
jgi:hypothetical protein